MIQKLTDRMIIEAFKRGANVFVEHRDKLDCRKHYDSQIYTEDYPLAAGLHELQILEVRIGNNSPVNWLTIEPKELTTAHIGLAIGYFVSEHNAGRLTIEIHEPAQEE